MYTMMLYELTRATGETLLMVFVSTFFSVVLGLPLGTLLFCYSTITPHKTISRITSSIINIFRSIPFIILLVALIPFTRLIVGTSIGISAAIVPLTIGATPLFARLVDNIYRNLPSGLIEAGLSMGASTIQTFRLILIPEAMPAFIQSITVTAITLVNYSAMAGTVGGGGLGDLAIRFGYQRFDISIMISTVVILIVIVQLIQVMGDKLAAHFSH